LQTPFGIDEGPRRTYDGYLSEGGLQEVTTARYREHEGSDEIGRTAGLRCLVDGHVHFYGLFDPWGGLEAAAEHFEKARMRLSLPKDAAGVLMRVRSSREDSLVELRGRLGGGLGGGIGRGWILDTEHDPRCLCATRDSDGATLYLVEGQQVRAGNGLEVLALASESQFEDGRAFGPTVEEIRDSGAVTVIPWGFGKWVGRRRIQVEDAVEERRSGPLFLGDNAGRPVGLPEPRLFREARARGVFVLPGSDPLPIPHQERSIGRFGFVLDGFDPSRPVESVRRALKSLRAQPAVFGARQRLLRSMCLQSLIQLRWPGSGPAPRGEAA